MKQTINVYQFRDAFRAIRPNNFSYEGLGVLFEYLEQYEEDTGEEMELDVIAICCDFSEDTWQNIAQNYRIDLSDCEDDEDRKEAVKTWLEDEGALVGEGDEGFVYRNV
jgi:predicted ArsR family transcriptional regulator